MSNPKCRKSCVVPKCTSTTIRTPEKLFFLVPKDITMRQKWLRAMRRLDPFGNRSTVYCCEDHFNIETDMDNYIKYKLVGGRLKLKKGLVPHKFQCQQENEDKPERSAVQKCNQIKYSEKLLNKDDISTLDAAEKSEETFLACGVDETVLEHPLSFEINNQCLEISIKTEEVQENEKEEGVYESTVISQSLQICRICLGADEELYPMTVNKHLYEAYEVITGLRLEDEVSLPRQLCAKCSRRLLQSVRLRERSLQAHRLLLEIIRNHEWVTQDLIASYIAAQGTVSSLGDTEETLIGEKNTEPDMRHQPCPFEDITDDDLKEEVFVNKEDLSLDENHVLNKSDSEDSEDENMSSALQEDLVHAIVKDEGMDCEVFDKDPLADDIDSPSHREDIDQSIVKDEEIHNEDVLEDPLDGEDNTSDGMKSEEAREVSYMDVRQPAVEEYMYRIQKASIEQSNLYSCAKCRYTTMDGANISTHIKKHMKKRFKCDVCNRSFVRKCTLASHLKTHSGRKSYSCDVKSSQAHPDKAAYSCVVCKKVFRKIFYLETRLEKVHPGVEGYLCVKCKDTFSKNAELKVNLRLCSENTACSLDSTDFDKKAKCQPNILRKRRP